MAIYQPGNPLRDELMPGQSAYRPRRPGSLYENLGSPFGLSRGQFSQAEKFFGNPSFIYNYHLNNQRQMFNNQRQRVENIMRQMEAGDQRARLHIDTSQAQNQAQNAIANLLQELARNRQQYASAEYDFGRTRLLDELRLRQQMIDNLRQGSALNPLALPSRARELLGR